MNKPPPEYHRGWNDGVIDAIGELVLLLKTEDLVYVKDSIEKRIEALADREKGKDG